jgi:hypothetical protein
MLDTSLSSETRIRSLRAEWLDLPTEFRFTAIAAVVVDVTAKIITWRSLIRRPVEKVRGPKWAWVVVSLINGVGPLSYLVLGRK